MCDDSPHLYQLPSLKMRDVTNIFYKNLKSLQCLHKCIF